ncbi:MAG: hypothetical protein ACXABH_10610 [Candidatus Thorarchaeota archaeon]|jgi:hypothetical protein
MKRKMTLLMLVMLLLVSFSSTPQALGYSSEIQASDGILWQIESTPSDTFNMFYTGGGNWLAQNETTISFGLDSFADDVLGYLMIGNVSVLANDTDIAKDLTLGVWGTPTEWWPGLIVKVGQDDIDSLNETAYASAERVSGNYLNGSMVSSLESINDVNDLQHQCIVFDYEQDPTGFGEPQRTHLAYSLDTGVLIEANTSYSFGTPYELAFRFAGIATITVVDLIADPGPIITVMGILGGILIAVVVLAFWRLSRSK